jgi:hypothetical protein
MDTTRHRQKKTKKAWAKKNLQKLNVSDFNAKCRTTAA